MKRSERMQRVTELGDRKVETAGRTLAVVLSGGNVDRQLYAEILAG